MIPPDDRVGGASLLACAAFHLGTPLVLARHGDGDANAGWPTLAAALSDAFAKSKGRLLMVAEAAAGRMFRFPLGEPLILQFSDADLTTELLNARMDGQGHPAARHPALLSHRIWVTPAGGVFLLLRHDLAGPGDEAAGELREWVEERYAELTLLFLMAAEALLAACHELRVHVDAAATSHERNIRAALCATHDLRRAVPDLVSANKSDKEAAVAAIIAKHECLEDWADKDVLIDVHYLSRRHGPARQVRIAYDWVDLVDADDELLEHLAVLYTAFPTAKWLLGALGDQSEHALNAAADQHRDDRLRAIQRMKLFCAALIAASQPIQIRIYRPMLVAMEENFAALRLPAMFDQIRAQIDTLSQETAALEARQRGAGDRRLSVALGGVTLLTALSSGFGVADFATKLGADKAIANGAMVVWIALLAAVFLVFFRRRAPNPGRLLGERQPRQGR